MGKVKQVRRKLAQFFNWRVSVTLTDGRVLVGTLMGVDRHVNLVLCGAEEYRRYRVKGKPEGKELKRMLGLIVVRGVGVLYVQPEELGKEDIVETEKPRKKAAAKPAAAPAGAAGAGAKAPGVVGALASVPGFGASPLLALAGRGAGAAAPGMPAMNPMLLAALAGRGGGLPGALGAPGAGANPLLAMLGRGGPVPGGLPGGLPGGMPGGLPAMPGFTMPGGMPGGMPGMPAGMPGGLPGGLPGMMGRGRPV